MAELLLFRESLSRYNQTQRFYEWLEKEIDAAGAPTFVAGSDMEKTWKQGQWIDKSHPAMRSADEYLAFLASQRGFSPTVTIKRSGK